MSQTMDMQNGNLFKKIIFFTIPIILSSILQLLYNAVDLIVVGQYCGDNSLAAVGSTSALTNLIINLFIGVSIGANVSVARAIGAKNEDKVQKLVHTAILFAIIAGVFLTIFGICTAGLWLEIMGTTADCIELATLYLQIYFGGMIFNMLYNFGAAILRAVGETKRPLYYLSVAGLANVGLNFLMVLVFHLDVAGVAIGTIVSQFLSAVMILYFLIKKGGIVQLSIKKLRIHKQCLLEMIWIGLPAGIQSSLFSISNVFIQSAVNSFDSTFVVAGNTASANIESFVYSAMNAFYQACITFTSRNIGAGKVKNCKKIMIYSLICVIVTGAILGGLAIGLDRPLIGIYTNAEEAITVGITRLWIICCTYFLCGIMEVFVGGLRGLGYSIVPMIVSIAGVCLFRLVWIYTAFRANPSIEILYLSYPISWLLTGAIHCGCYLFVYRKKKQAFAN